VSIAATTGHETKIAYWPHQPQQRTEHPENVLIGTTIIKTEYRQDEIMWKNTQRLNFKIF
jgi:hypothetical protein